MKKWILKSCLITFILLPSFSFAAGRVALIIANSNYKNIGSLSNPVADATAVATQLKKLGFSFIRPIKHDTDVQTDLTLEQLLIAQDALLTAATGKQIAFLYYAGHGASLGRNLSAHIIPIDVSKPKQQSNATLGLLTRQSFSLDSLLNGLDQKAELTVAVFDACREIPELEKTMGIFDRIRGNAASWRGLGRIKHGKNRIIAYSGAQGQIVADGDGTYSPYTEKLIEVLKTNPFQEVGNLFRDVATQVESFTGQYPVVEMQGVPPNRFYFAKRQPAGEQDKRRTDEVTPQTIQDTTPHLTINPTPANARIRILNIIPKYQDGIMLKAGRYHIEVSQKGYKRSLEWITLNETDENKIINVVLEKAPERLPFEPEMVNIRGGTFTMGSPANEKDRYRDEKPHRVTVKDFWIGKTEVTFAQWGACVAGGGCQSNKYPKDQGWGRGNRPVINVSWHDANEYTRWLSQKTGKEYRLPTEAEWEYAARGGTKTVYAWGNSLTHTQANYGTDNCCNGLVKGKDRWKNTAPVASFPVNKGLYDMHGNVLEWTCSAYDKNYGGSERQCAKKNDNRSRVLRGGSWDDIPRSLRSAYRNYLSATDRDLDVGFRISRTF